MMIWPLFSVLCSSALAAPLGPNVTLRKGTIMPSIGLGSSGSCHPDVQGTERSCPNYNATLSAIQLGYRSFHDALSYGNQAGLGAAIKASRLERSEVFVMSMVPKYLMGHYSLSTIHYSLTIHSLLVFDGSDNFSIRSVID